MMLVCLWGPLIAFGLAAGIAGTDNVVASPYHAATLVSLVVDRAQGVSVAAGDLMRALVDWFAGSYRERVQHWSPPDLLMDESELTPVAERSMRLWNTF